MKVEANIKVKKLDFSGFFYVMILKINLEKQFLSEINDQNNELSLPFSRFFKISDGEIIYCKK